MEIYNGRVVLTGEEIIGNICTKSKYDNLKRAGKLRVVRRGCRGNTSLIDFETINDPKIKRLVVERIGDPAKVIKTGIITSAICHDEEARKLFNEHITPSGQHLPAERINEYIANAEVLNAIKTLLNDKKAIRKVTTNNQRGIWESIAENLSYLDRLRYPHSLPENPARLREKFNNYRKEGYYSLIHKGYGNKNTEKLSELSKLWVLARWANQVERVTSFDHMFRLYNKEAVTQGWKPLESPQTIRNFLESEGIKELWYGYRYGELKSKEKYSLQHSTRLPSMRDSLWYSDGTKLNYFYLSEAGKIETISVYEVMDAYSECFLGYHISKSEDFEAQFKAYKMAVQTAGHLPYQISFDNQGGHKKLENAEFLTKLARLTISTQPYNGKSKTIESAFGRFQEQYLKQDWFFTGQNITAKKIESRANMEFILANKANLPSLEQATARYIELRTAWQNAPHPKTGVPRSEMYRNSYNQETKPVELQDMVDLFWMLRPEPVMMTAYGLSFTEKKVKYEYLVYSGGMPDQKWLAKNIDRKFFVKFDPDDMSMIYLYEKDALGLRFVTVAETKVTVARGKQEQENWETTYITRVNNTNKELREDRSVRMDDILKQFDMLPENYGLKSPAIKGITSKVKKAEPVESIGRYEKAVSNAIIEEEGKSDLYSIL
jgi:hypothetical protein